MHESVFVNGLFSEAGSDYLQNLSDRTKANRLINGVDHVNVGLIRTFPANDKIEEVTTYLDTYIDRWNFNKIINKFGLTIDRESTICMAYALAKEFFEIIKTAEADSDAPTNMTNWYNQCLNQPLIYKNSFDDDFKSSLYADSGYRCPVTNKILKDNNTQIIQIYQKDIDDELKERLLNELGEKEPDNEMSISNCLAVHKDFAKQYNLIGKNDFNYIKLALDGKRLVIDRKVNSSTINALELNSQVKALISMISESSLADPLGEDVRLNYDPVDVEEKIPEDPMLVSMVTSISNAYYKKIKNWFLLSEQTIGKPAVKNITESVKARYEELALTVTDKRKLVNLMINWFIDECHLNGQRDRYKEPARILVYFFIQNCEVFKKHEIAE